MVIFVNILIATLISINQEREINESIVLSQEDKVLSHFDG